MKMMLAALMSSDGRAILPKLVSKPDALRKICDCAEIGSPDDAPDLPARYLTSQSMKSRAYAEFQCTCNPRRVSKTRKRRIGLAFMEQERVTDMVHSHWCRFARFNTPSNDKWSFGISVKALRGILNAALTISMSATFGAGGFGLSPSFTYFPIREDSPALRVLSILQDAFEKRTWSDEEADHLLRRGIQTLQATITARKWSPFDIDRHGRSLLEAASSGSKSTWQGNQIKILAFFLSLGVPRDRPNNLGA
ncbi:hypothetical protein INS49_007064 [Diaporthe citri]|uniref:uncharacterized protein n=1 Tax=Diaporthe citri TaxID=83186 RepID=UPI001C821910|nr:uncharacterized protein INS49_007064 [Diaporthe citri]KAG6365453.1 hypothetical protein INS49_007064 [Diaporthe citri]